MDIEIPQSKPIQHRFYDHTKQNGFLSNFFPSPFTVDNFTYPTAEHFYQSQKFDPGFRRQLVASAGSPKQAKHIAHVFLWADKKNSNGADATIAYGEALLAKMQATLYYKFANHLDLTSLLICMPGEIIEASPTDYFWGEGEDKTGKNHLGRLLMKLRDGIISGEVVL